MKLRLTAVVATAAAAVCAAPATGAMRQVSQVVDPKGDARGAKSFYDGCGNPGDPLGTTALYDEVSVAVRGRTITWSVPVGAMPGQSIDLGRGNAVWRIR